MKKSGGVTRITIFEKSPTVAPMFTVEIKHTHRFMGKGSRNMATATKKTKVIDDKQLRSAANVFDMASDPTRLKILLALDCDDDINVGGLATITNQSQPAVSHHLSLMRHGRFVEAVRHGKHSVYKLLPLGETVVKTYAAVLND